MHKSDDGSPSGGSDTPSSGGLGLAGYEYQIDASVWLALDVMLVSKLATHITLEPSSQEDVEADIDEFEPGRVKSTARLGCYRLIVQAKMRTGNAWTAAKVVKLLNHGSPTRKSALAQLADPGMRYLLITSAAVNTDAKPLVVASPGAWPSKAKAASFSSLPPEEAERVAILAIDGERLQEKAERLLTHHFHVPFSRWKGCWDELRNQARCRVLGQNGGCWQRDDLERVIHAHEGYLASSPELDGYVRPKNWTLLHDILRREYALLLVGASGTGKTLTAKKLIEAMRESVPGLLHVNASQGPHVLREYAGGPVIFEIEDPWGKFAIDVGSRGWNHVLPAEFAHARHDRMLVVTTRRDVASQAEDALERLASWGLALEASEYGPEEWSQLYAARVAQLPRGMQAVAEAVIEKVRRRLATPLEIQKFFDALLLLTRNGANLDATLIQKAIDQAHIDAIESTIVNQVREQKDGVGATLLWALMRVIPFVPKELLRRIDNRLFDVGNKYERGMEPLVDFLIEGRNLKLGEGVISYYHSRVESGLQRAMLDEGRKAGQTLGALVGVLVAEGKHDPTLMVLAVDIQEASHAFDKARPRLDASSQDAIDAWLSQHPVAEGAELARFLSRAAAAGSPDSIEAELARYLLNFDSDTKFGEFWRAPDREQDWYVRMRVSPRAHEWLVAFVRTQLPSVDAYYPTDFADYLAKLDADLTPAFLAAAHEIVGHGYRPAADAVAYGALKDVPTFEPILTAALSVLEATPEEIAKRQAGKLAIINGEYSDDYVFHLQDDDDGQTAGEFVQAYITQARRGDGWRALRAHAHRNRLLRDWLWELRRKEAAPPTPDELDALIGLAYGTNDEPDLWVVLDAHWDARFVPLAERRLLAGHGEVSVRRGAIEAVLHEPPATLVAIFNNAASVSTSCQVNLAVDLGRVHADFTRDKDESQRAVRAGRAIKSLSPTLAEIATAAGSTGDANVALSQAPVALLEVTARPSEETRSLRLRADGIAPDITHADADWILEFTDDDQAAIQAIEHVIRFGRQDRIEAVLQHRFGHVVARALRAVAATVAGALPDSILELRNSRSRYVRAALVECLSQDPGLPAHQAALLYLSHDDWTPSYRSNGQPLRLPIALAAVQGIQAAGVLDPKGVAELLQLADTTPDAVLKRATYTGVCHVGGPSGVDEVLERALRGGRRMRLAAAWALIDADSCITPAQAEVIPVDEILEQGQPAVAVLLTVAWATNVPVDVVCRGAMQVRSHARRQALVLVIYRCLQTRDHAAAASLGELFPSTHMVARWIREDGNFELTPEHLADFGDASTVSGVLKFVNLSA